MRAQTFLMLTLQLYIYIKLSSNRNELLLAEFQVIITLICIGTACTFVDVFDVHLKAPRYTETYIIFKKYPCMPFCTPKSGIILFFSEANAELAKCIQISRLRLESRHVHSPTHITLAYYMCIWVCILPSVTLAMQYALDVRFG
jgi:hypothetical protein